MGTEERTKKRKALPGRQSIVLFVAICSFFIFAGAVFSDGDSISMDVTTAEDGDHTRVDITGLLVNDRMPKQGAVVGIVVSDESGRNVFADEVMTDGEGEYASSFKIITEDSGAYTVYAAPASAYAENMVASETFTIGCVEEWVCTGWSVCNSNLRQTRTCTDNNQCGTAVDKPATSRECTCALQSGDICKSSETCSGYFIDATDTNLCCDGVCRSRQTSTSTGSSSSVASYVSPTDTEDDAENAEAEEKEDPTAADDPHYADEAEINNTANQTSGTDSIYISENKKDEISDNPDENNTPTGMFDAVIGSSRWIVADAILIGIMMVFAGRILAARKNNKKTGADHPAGWSNGKYKYRLADTGKRTAGRQSTSKPRKETYRAPAARTKVVKVRM